MRKDVSFANKRKELLKGDLYLPENLEKPPVIVALHGYRGNRQGLARLAGEMAVKAGYAVLAFDRAGQGESQGDFEEKTVTREAEDIAAAVDHLSAINDIDSNEIGLFATSGSSYAALIASNRDKRIKSLVLSVPVINYFKLGSRHPEYRSANLTKWENDGIIKIKGQKSLKYQFVRDFMKYDLNKLAKQIEIPTFVHCSRYDEVIADAEHDTKIFFKNLASAKKKLLVTDTKHPYHKTSEELRNSIFLEFIHWFKDTLSGVKGL